MFMVPSAARTLGCSASSAKVFGSVVVVTMAVWQLSRRATSLTPSGGLDGPLLPAEQRLPGDFGLADVDRAGLALGNDDRPPVGTAERDVGDLPPGHRDRVDLAAVLVE